MRRVDAGHYTDIVLGHDVDLDRHRVGPWKNWWTIAIDGEHCGWFFRGRWEAIANIDKYINGYIERELGRG